MGRFTFRLRPLAVIAVAAMLFLCRVAAGGVEPKSALPSPALKLSENPSAAEIRAARIFSEPLVPAGRRPSVQENRRLAAALRDYEQRQTADDFSALEQYLRGNPDSSWAPAVWFNLATE